MKSKIAKLTFLFLIVAVFYNNCGRQFQGGEYDSSSSAGTNSIVKTELDLSGLFSGDNCDQGLKLLFANGFHKFSMANCAFCHSNGPGKGRFASGVLEQAFTDFMQTGYTKFSDNATSNSHNPPYSGPQHIQAINELRLEWQKGLESFNKCKGIDGNPDNVVPNLKDILNFETTQKTVPPMEFNEQKTMDWEINGQLIVIQGDKPLPQIPGAKFSIRVGKYKTATNNTYYTFSSPRIFGSSKDIWIKTMQMKINGRLMAFPTTFKFVDKGIYANSSPDKSDSLITTGAVVAPGVLSPADRISIAFEKIEETTLPPPAPPVLVNFAKSNIQSVNSNTGKVDVELVLSQASVGNTTVSVSVNEDKFCPDQGNVAEFNIKSCLPSLAQAICPLGNCTDPEYTVARARSVISPDGSGNRFDWDYKFTNSSVTFAPGQISKTITIQFSKDIRKESNRVLTLKMDPVLLGANAGPINQITFLVQKFRNPTPPAGILTFSELMNKNFGILGRNCVKCHNSVAMNGGYDMTNYELMLERKVLVPGNEESKMFFRMNPSSPNYIQLQPMPFDGALDKIYRDEVRAWILNGAPNN